MTDDTSAIAIEEIQTYFESLEMERPPCIIDRVERDLVHAHIPVADVRTRPGGFVPGPTIMGAVDLLGWVLVFTRVGLTPMALTWDLSVNFLRPAHGSDVLLTARQTKFGRLSHASYDIAMRAEPDKLVAHATTTYVVPDDR